MLHTYVFVKKIDLDPHIDPYILTICGPSAPNGQGQRGGAGAWAEEWDKAEGVRGWGGGLGQGGGARAWVGGALVKT